MENEPYASAVLRKHWPGVKNHGDITKIDWEKVEPVEVLTGGFPCTDISNAGKGAGIGEGTRSGLWSYFKKAIGVLRPRIVLVENVAALVGWFDETARPAPSDRDVQAGRRRVEVEQRQALAKVLGDLAEIGYDAEWFTLCACDVGAPHRRERLFVVAYPCREREQAGQDVQGGESYLEGGIASHAHARREFLEEKQLRTGRQSTSSNAHDAGGGASSSGAHGKQSQEEQGGRITFPEPAGHVHASEPHSERLKERDALLEGGSKDSGSASPHRNGFDIERHIKRKIRRFPEFAVFDGARSASDFKGRSDIPEPLLRRKDYELSRGMDRIKCLGNAVVPACAQVIGEALIEAGLTD